MSSSTADEIRITKLDVFTSLTLHIREMEASLEGLKKELAGVEGELLEELSGLGVNSIRNDAGTVSIRRELWAKCKDGDYDRACRALTMAGLGEFVQPRFNSNSLSAYVRELDRDEKPLPAELEGAIDVAEVFKLRLTKR